MKWSVVGLLVLGVIAALSAALLLQLLSGKRADEIRVLVARQDLPANTLIEKASLEEMVIPRSKLPEGAMTNSIEAVGNIIKESVVAGQPLRKDMFLTGEQKALLKRLQPGQRAVAISLSDFAGLEGVLYEGSMVDVLLTMNGEHGKQLQRVLEKVQVIALDGKGSGARRVTLQVTAEQAARLSLAGSQGALSLSLRHPLDPERRGEVSMAVLTGAPQKPSWLERFADATRAAMKTQPVAAPASKTEPVQEVVAPPIPKIWTTRVIRGDTVEIVEFPGWTDPQHVAKD